MSFPFDAINDLDVEEDPKLCFVLMPFDEKYLEVYKQVIKPVVESFGIRCIRADDIYSTNPIMEDIISSILKANLIIADLTGKNPNVFYELGIAHSKKQNVILITQTLDDVPFDLKSLRVIVYNQTINGAAELKRALHHTINYFVEEKHVADLLKRLGPLVLGKAGFGKRAESQWKEKENIGGYISRMSKFTQAAINLVIDSGTTNVAIARKLVENHETTLKNNPSQVTTNNVIIGLYLMPSKIKCQLVGGEVEDIMAGVFGKRAREDMGEASGQCDIAIMSTTLFDIIEGPRADSPKNRDIKHVMLEKTGEEKKEIIIAFDYTKWIKETPSGEKKAGVLVYEENGLWQKRLQTGGIHIIVSAPIKGKKSEIKKNTEALLTKFQEARDKCKGWGIHEVIRQSLNNNNEKIIHIFFPPSG